MKKSNKLIILTLAGLFAVFSVGIAFIIGSTVINSEDLTKESKNVLVLGCDKTENVNGAVDMAFMVHLENGTLKNYTPVYPGGKIHPTVASTRGGNLLLHDCLDYGVDDGMQYAKEIVKSSTGMESDLVVLVNNEGLDKIIDSIRPLEVDGKVTDLNSIDIIRENDAYYGYSNNQNVKGTMSRGDAVMVLVKALANAAKDSNKKSTMTKVALEEFNNGNIKMKPEGSFVKLLATKGFESLTS